MILVAIVTLLGLAFLQARYAIPRLACGDDEWAYLILGPEVVRRQRSVYDDSMVGNRSAMPFWLVGLTQLRGFDLRRARRLGAVVNVLAHAATCAAGWAVGGPWAGVLALAWMVAHRMLSHYYVLASYHGLSALFTALGVLAIAGAPAPWDGRLGVAAFVLVAAARPSFAVLVPPVVLFAGPSTGLEVAVRAAIALTPLALFLASRKRRKVLAYVPGLAWATDARSNVALGAGPLFPPVDLRRDLVWFARQHWGWFVATGPLYPWAVQGAAPWALLATWGVLAHAAIYRRHLKTLAAHAVGFAPLWAVALAAATASEGRAVVIAVAVLMVTTWWTSRSAAYDPDPTHSVIRDLAEVTPWVRAQARPEALCFVIGLPTVAAVAGWDVPPQQAAHTFTLVPSTSPAVYDSGLWGPQHITTWLEYNADVATIEHGMLDVYRGVRSYRNLVAQIEALLAAHFRSVGQVAVSGKPITVYVRSRA